MGEHDHTWGGGGGGGNPDHTWAGVGEPDHTGGGGGLIMGGDPDHRGGGDHTGRGWLNMLILIIGGTLIIGRGALIMVGVGG